MQCRGAAAADADGAELLRADLASSGSGAAIRSVTGLILLALTRFTVALSFPSLHSQVRAGFLYRAYIRWS